MTYQHILFRQEFPLIPEYQLNRKIICEFHKIKSLNHHTGAPGSPSIPRSPLSPLKPGLQSEHLPPMSPFSPVSPFKPNL